MVDGRWEVVGECDGYGGEERLEVRQLEGRDCCGIQCEEVG
jgi:hypothetical protein